MKQVTEILYRLRQRGQKGLAVLLDPDKAMPSAAAEGAAAAEAAGVDLLLLGGSLVSEGNIHELAPALKRACGLPVVLFPGNPNQITPEADALLFLSLISGRNAELLIGQHVTAAPLLRKTELEVIPTAYMLVDCGRFTTVQYISGTLPIPYDKPDIAVCTAMAGEYLGLKLLYVDGGSGAARPVSTEMVRALRAAVQLPLIIGGGIRHPEQAAALWEAGADLLVVGTALEQESSGELLKALCAAKPRHPVQHS